MSNSRFPDNAFLSSPPFVSVGVSKRRIVHAAGSDEIITSNPDLGTRKWLRYKTRNKPLLFNHYREAFPDFKTRKGNRGKSEEMYSGAPAEPVMSDVIEEPPVI